MGMDEQEIIEFLNIQKDDDVCEKSAKIIEWLLNTSWYETWSTSDSSNFSGYVAKVVADLRNLK